MSAGAGDAEALDRDDPLARFREEFVFEEGGPLYVDGNSLGRLPARTPERLAALVDEWATALVRGWQRWIDLPVEVGDLLAETVLGARPGEVVVTDSVTVNLYKLARAALGVRPGRRAVVTDAGNFPTDRYVLEGLGCELRLVEADPVEGPDAAGVEAACAPGDVALVALSHVAYRSGALADLPAVTEAAHAAGALALWDLSHSAGAVTVGLEEHGVDLAVGCTYKYLNAGPGAPAFLYVRSELQEELRTPIQGWFGQRDQFAMERPYEPAEGVARFLAGTPSVPGLVAVRAGAELVAEAGIDAIAAKGRSLTAFAIELHDARLAALDVGLGTPRDPARRGAHVALRHADGWRLCRALIERAAVVPDFRGPDTVRFGFPPLYTRFADVREAIERLRRVLERGEHLEVDASLTRVT
ncbi:MAG TPA: kynureninase [Gaiellaceae bacterium]|nr:kynureninase [Gaiellaceae bacterium]